MRRDTAKYDRQQIVQYIISVCFVQDVNTLVEHKKNPVCANRGWLFVNYIDNLCPMQIPSMANKHSGYKYQHEQNVNTSTS